jgi:hypothetical protein
MKSIFKYEVPLTDLFTLSLPPGYEVVHFGEQHGVMYIWVLLNPALREETVEFRLYGTGHIISNPEDKEYIGTCINGEFVWHLFNSTK